MTSSTRPAHNSSQVDQWMSGDSLMVAPILTSSDGQTTDTQRSVYLPAATWHQLRWSQGNFSFIASHQGAGTISVTGVQFADMLLFGRAGGVVFMGPLLQYTDAVPGGCLQPLVFRCVASCNKRFSVVSRKL